LSISNGGPATAVGVSLTDTLSPGVSFLYAQPTTPITLDPARLRSPISETSGTQYYQCLRGCPNRAPGTLTNIATIASTVFDPLKAGIPLG